MRFIGFEPLWGNLVERCQENRLLRVLVFPLWLWEAMWYYTRPNNLEGKLVGKGLWLKMGSAYRYPQALFAYFGPPSHVLWNIKYVLTAVMAVAVGVTVYGYYEVNDPSLPELDRTGVFLRCYRTCIFILSLLLSLRMGRAYDRWWSARQAVGAGTSSPTKLVMQAACVFRDEWLVEELARWANVWQYTIYAMVTQQPKHLPEKAWALMDAEERAVYESARSRRYVVWQKMLQIIVQADLPEAQNQILDVFLQRAAFEGDNCARLRYSALPHNLTLMSTGFLQIWLMLVPVGLWRSGDWWGLFSFFFVALLLLGCDEVATQLEDPFPFLPCLDILKVQVRDVRKVIDEGKILKRMAERPRAASGIGHVSGTEVDHAKSDVPLLAAQGVGPNLAAAERREF